VEAVRNDYDDLSDVVLQGKNLVSNDPSAWWMCRSLTNASDVYDWWQELVRSDDAAWAGWTSERLAALRVLRDRFDQTWAQYRHTLEDRRALRSVFVEILGMGLDLGQTATLCATSKIHVARSLIVTRNLDTSEVYLRVEAEKLLRNGVSQRDIARRLGMTRDEVQKWASTLGIESPRQNRYGAAKPKAVRERAMELYDAGLRGKEIVAVMQREMPEEAKDLTGTLVGQWATRSGRTKRAA
jgi:hypothetical protein